MAKKVWKPGTLVAPVPPVLVSCGDLEHPNLLTVAWTGILCSDPPLTYISVRPERFSHHLIQQSGEFVINLTPSRLVRAVDFCGVRSGRDTDKWKETGLTPEASGTVKAPQVLQCPITIECRVRQVMQLGSHDMFLSEIVAVNVEESAVDATGKLRMDQCGLMAYAHGDYFALGKKVGYFGFSVKKKKKSPPRGRG